jgi:hypothetical protein
MDLPSAASAVSIIISSKVGLLDQHDRFAQLGCADCGCVPAGTGSNNKHIHVGGNSFG